MFKRKAEGFGGRIVESAASNLAAVLIVAAYLISLTALAMGWNASSLV